MNELEQDYYSNGAYMTARQQNVSDYDRHLAQAVRRIKQIESERILLRGHFSKVAKEYSVKVKDLTHKYATDSRYDSK